MKNVEPVDPLVRTVRRILLGALVIGPALAFAACSGGEEGSAGATGVTSSSPSTAQPDEASSAAAAGADEASQREAVSDQMATHPVPYPGSHKVVHIPMQTDGPKTLDPVQGSTMYDNRCCSLVYQTLLQYAYLKRPLQLEPLLAAKMPDISADGKTWTFTLRDDAYFRDDPCFPGGKGRKLVAGDVVYSWKRLADPQYKYKNWWLIEDTLVGFDDYKKEQAARVDAGQPFDYDAPVEGLQAPDDTTLVLKLNEPVQQLSWKLAMFQLSVVPREAVDKYGDGFSGHPVGTGPYLLEKESDWQRSKSLRLVRNPDYFDEHFPQPFDDYDRKMGMDRYAGQKLPIVDEVQITFFIEQQPMWLEFKAGHTDYTTVPEFGFYEAFKQSDKQLKTSWARKGITDFPLPLLDFIFRGFNMEDPLVGGYTPEKKALRQAICLSIDYDEMNEAYYNGECIVYDGMIPPGLDGFPSDPGPDGKPIYGYSKAAYRGKDLDHAREKLQEAGYHLDADGKATDVPVIEFYTSRGATSEKMVDLIMRNVSAIGIRLNPHFVDFSELIEAIGHKKAPMFSFAWGSDYPDAENNLALFYGPNESPGSNHFNYKRADYDELYRKIKTMQPGPERTKIYAQMRDMVLEDAPFSGSLARVRRYLIQPWLQNFKPTETFYNYVKYWDVDMSAQGK